LTRILEALGVADRTKLAVVLVRHQVAIDRRVVG
jgi:hypothetical protein